MSFHDFPHVGTWQIKFYDDNDKDKTEYSQHVFCTEYLDDYYLMRTKTKSGWDFSMAERQYKLHQRRDGTWSMGTWMSVIVIIDAFRVNEVV